MWLSLPFALFGACGTDHRDGPTSAKGDSPNNQEPSGAGAAEGRSPWGITIDEGEPPDEWYDETCLAAGTRVATPLGPRLIEHLEIGDAVLSLDEATGEIRANRVTFIRSAEDEVHALHEPGHEKIWATKTHQFFDSERGEYVALGSLGQRPALVRMDNPESALIGPWPLTDASVTIDQERSRSSRVYDITVSRDHNFFAGGLLVHNKSGAGPCIYLDVWGVAECVNTDTLDVSSPDDGWSQIVRFTDNAGVGGIGGESGTAGASFTFQLARGCVPSGDEVGLRVVGGSIEYAFGTDDCLENSTAPDGGALAWSTLGDDALFLYPNGAEHLHVRVSSAAVECVRAGGRAALELGCGD